ncbi:unnamed protein product [Lampetra planeri]
MAAEVGDAAGDAVGLGGEDEEQWLYGGSAVVLEAACVAALHLSSRPPADVPAAADDKGGDLPLNGNAEETNGDGTEANGTEDAEDDSDSDSDDDDVQVTIGDIKTGAPQYTGVNLNIKPGARPYGASSAAGPKQVKGVDLDAPGSIAGIPVLEVDLDSFEDKPWRKPGADLSDYFNFGFNEDTWKAYCEKQKRLRQGLDPLPSGPAMNRITVQQGRTGNLLDKEQDMAGPTLIKTEFPLQQGGLRRMGPPPHRKLSGTIDVIGSQMIGITRVEGRRRDRDGLPEPSPIQARAGLTAQYRCNHHIYTTLTTPLSYHRTATAPQLRHRRSPTTPPHRCSSHHTTTTPYGCTFNFFRTVLGTLPPPGDYSANQGKPPPSFAPPTAPPPLRPMGLPPNFMPPPPILPPPVSVGPPHIPPPASPRKRADSPPCDLSPHASPLLPLVKAERAYLGPVWRAAERSIAID